MTALPRQVVCSAIRNSKGLVICAPRHHHCTTLAHALGVYEASREDGWEQGFVDQKNRFLTRAQALKLAKKRGQVQRRTGGGAILFSEDLY